MDTQLPFLLLLSWAFLLNSSLARGAAGGLHPVVLLPGYGCSQLDVPLTELQKGWFRLWEKYTALQENTALVPCYAELLRLVYDPAAGDYHGVPGVEIRVVSFGTTRGFRTDNPARKNTCMEKLVTALEGVGYREDESLFGVPYEFWYAAAPPGQASRAFSDFTSRLRLLVEHASERNGGRPIILVTHSPGGFNANVFLTRSPLAWRRRFVKHFAMVSTGAGGSVALLPTGSGCSPPSPGDVLSFANTSRSFASALIVLPSPKVFGHKPLVITRAKNNSADDIPEYLKAQGFSDGEVARYLTRVLLVSQNFRAPAVPVTCMNGVGVPTVEKLIYLDGDFSSKPRVVYGDGDGGINVASILALDTLIEADPEQGYFKSVLIRNTSHNGMISDDFALESVVNEVLEANRDTD